MTENKQTITKMAELVHFQMEPPAIQFSGDAYDSAGNNRGFSVLAAVESKGLFDEILSTYNIGDKVLIELVASDLPLPAPAMNLVSIKKGD